MTRLIAVTGCCGFIGRAVTEALLVRGDYVYGVDALTYAADPSLPGDWTTRYGPERFHFVCQDINALGRFPEVDTVINLAAETHVDNSLTDPMGFVRTNVHGVAHLLEMCRAMRQYEIPRFIQISTDEVYGDILHGMSGESDPLNPSSPYAASKAAADMLVMAWGRSYGIPWNIIRPSNCYGLYQYPEKLIPKAIRWSLLGRAVPVHGDGTQTRSWLSVKDCVTAILTVLDRAPANETYNIGGNTEASVTGVVAAATAALGITPLLQEGYVRAGMDLRYRVSDTKLRVLGWVPEGHLWTDLPGIVAIEKERFRW